METTEIDQPETGAAGEEAASLKMLERMAGEDPASQPDPDMVAAELARPTLDQEISGMLQVLAKVVGPFLPSVAELYTPEACEAVGAAVAPVCEKHGWLQGGMAGEWGPEIMCLVVVGPMAFATYGAAQKDLSARAARNRKDAERRGDVQNIGAEAPKRAATAPGALSVPGSDTVSFGVPVAP